MRKKGNKNDKNIWILLAVLTGIIFMTKKTFSITIKTNPEPSSSNDASGAFSGGGAGGGGGGVW